ncbi:MAG: FtsB family cell division protein [Acidimicrobiales bacterium]
MSQARPARLPARSAPRRASSEAAAAIVVPPLRLVDDSARPHRRALTRAVTVLAATLAAVGLFGVVSLHVLLAQGQAGLDTLHTRADAAAVQNKRLTVDVAQLEAPDRVIEWARQRLGMVPLAAIVYVPAADPGSPLPPVPDGPTPAAAKAAASATATPKAPSATPSATPTATPTRSPTPKPATAVAAVGATATAAKGATTATTLAHRQTPPTTPAARNP